MNRFTYIGERVRQFRKLMGLSQDKLAELLESVPSTVSRWENNVHTPQKKFYERLSIIFEHNGYTYDELGEEDLYMLRLHELQLLQAMRDDDYCKIQEEKNILSKLLDGNGIMAKQIMEMAELMLAREKKKITIEDFIKECAKIFELNCDMPPFENIENTNLTQIEYLILFKMAEAYIETEEIDKAQYILKGIYKALYKRVEKNQFFREHVVSCSICLARIYLEKRCYREASLCLDYIFEVCMDNFSLKSFVKGLNTLCDICYDLCKESEAKAIYDFMKSLENMLCVISSRTTSFDQ